ncbi:hypothetical protein I5677_05220 [Mobilitalea sibirica]|uniref:Uncharacterized protein n=1 Tax=Mobilitalea sibirica TaxID=1462919 RepID=A0A8J7H8I9_9FIRM|nr:hypothetical protein [Mobilitalea sibirica]MBH1940295.1 hypothetical protein [Mobilitalea sibirica]
MDEEFRKPYEYNEEKRGFILLFVIMILLIDILQILSFNSQIYEIFKSVPVLAIGFMVMGILFILFTVFTAATCFMLRRNMVIISKNYLIVRAVFSTISVLIIYIHRINNENLIGGGVDQYQTNGEMLMGELIIPLSYVLVFSIVWYLYFLRSKRCKEISKPVHSK